MISFEEFRAIYETVDAEPEFEISFCGTKTTYMIIKYNDKVSSTSSSSAYSYTGVVSANSQNGVYSFQLKKDRYSTVGISDYDFINVSGTLFEDYKTESGTSTSDMKKPIISFQCSSYVNGSFAKKSELSDVATSGQYDDLSGKPLLSIRDGDIEKLFPTEIVDFVEIVPTSQYSNNIIVNYEETI